MATVSLAVASNQTSENFNDEVNLAFFDLMSSYLVLAFLIVVALGSESLDTSAELIRT